MKKINESELSRKYDEATKLDSTCGECGMPMELIKGKKRRKYGKYNDYYKCSNCGNQFRKRTQNEILRDIGARHEKD